MTQHATHRRRRLAALVAFPLSLALPLAGCQAGGGDDGQAVTLRFITETAFGETSPYGAIIDEFNETNDQNITVKLEEIPTEDYFSTLRTMFQAGNAPDVVWGSPGRGASNALGTFADAGQLVDLSDEEWATAAVPESAEELYYVDDTLTAVPVNVAPVAQVVNVTGYESAGLDFAASFDELIEQCGAARDAGLSSLFGLAGSQASNTGLLALEVAGSRVYAEDPDWNQKRADGEVTFADSEGWQDTLQAVLDMNDAGCFQDGAAGGSPETVTPEFTVGKILAIFAPASIATDLGSLAPDAEISVAPFPGETADDTFVFASPSNALAINAASENIDAAKALLEFWMQPEQLDTFAELSGNVSVTSVIEGEPVAERFATLEPYLTDPTRNAPLPNLFWPSTEVYDALGVGIQGLLTGQAEVQQVLESMDAAWQD